MRSVALPSAAYLRRYADAALEGCWLTVAAIAPLYVDLLRAQPTQARGLVIQSIAVFMALLWVVQRGAARRAGAAPDPGWPWRGPLHLSAGATLAILAAAYAATTLVATAVALVPGPAIWGAYLRGEGAFASLAYLVLFLVVADRLRTRAQVDRLVNVLLAASVPVCLYALAQAAGLDPLRWHLALSGRVVSTGGNPIFLGAYLALLAPLTIWRLRQSEPPAADAPRGWLGAVVLAGMVLLLAGVFLAAATRLQAWWGAPALIAAFALVVAILPGFTLPRGAGGEAMAGRVRRLAYLALLIMQLWVMVLTASRGPIVALVGAIAVGLAVVAWRAREWRVLLGVGTIVLVLLGGVATLWVPNSPLEPVAEQVPLLRRIAEMRGGDTGARARIWAAAGQAMAGPADFDGAPDPVAALRPWVGYGPETVVYLLNRVLPPPSRLDLTLGEFWDRSHNALLDRLLTTGALGLAAYLALVLLVIVVAFRRVPREEGVLAWGLCFALAVALLGHLIETQFSMLVLPGEAVFWLLAGVAVSRASVGRDLAPGPAAAIPLPDESAPAARRGGRRGARADAPAATCPPGLTRPAWEPAAVYLGAVVVALLVLLQVSAPDALLPAAVLAVAATLGAPLAAGLALAPSARASSDPPGDTGAAAPAGTATAGQAAGGVAIVALVAGVTLLLVSHQLRAFAADVAFRRAEVAQLAGDFPGAVVAGQQAVRLAPDQAEYYHVLAQYYGALAGSTRSVPRPGYEPAPPDVATVDPNGLGREQLFVLGRLSLEQALRWNPLEARYHVTLGELHRYWGEVSGQPARLAEAEAAFARALALKPHDVEIHAGLADTLLLRGEPARALAAAQHAETLLPTYWYPYDVQARAYQALNQPAAALLAAGRALAMAPLNPGQKTPSPYDTERLRQVIRQAIATGETAIRPGAVVRGTPSLVLYQFSDTLEKRQFASDEAFRSCGYREDAVRTVPDPVLVQLLNGPSHTGCR